MDDLLNAFERMLDQIASLDAVRLFERSGDGAEMWSALQASGFLDAFLPEEAGGAGLRAEDVTPLLLASGRRLVPVPLSETMLARALAAACDTQLPVDSGVLLWPLAPDGSPRSMISPARGGATHALVQQGTTVTLLPVNAGPKDGFGIETAKLEVGSQPLLRLDLRENVLWHWATMLTVAAMAGAMLQTFDMTATYVNDRHQFGRPLAKLQIIQQQLSVMAEHVAMANTAVYYAFARSGAYPDAPATAVAKTIADRSATSVVAIAHAAHGAIGMTAEHDLSMYTRRLNRWRMMYGSSRHWSKLLGEARLAASGTSVDYVRSI